MKTKKNTLKEKEEKEPETEQDDNDFKNEEEEFLQEDDEKETEIYDPAFDNEKDETSKPQKTEDGSYFDELISLTQKHMTKTPIEEILSDIEMIKIELIKDNILSEIRKNGKND